MLRRSAPVRFRKSCGFAVLAAVLLVAVAPRALAQAGPEVPLETQKIHASQAFGLDLVGNVSYAITLSTAIARLKADQVRNSRSTGISGTLRLALWFSTTQPVFGQSITGYNTATYVLGQLGAGLSFFNVDSGNIGWTRPPDGTYFVTLTLDEFQSTGSYAYVDFLTFTNQQTIGNPCTPSSTVACVQNRFRITVAWSVPSQGTSGNGQIVTLTSDTIAVWFFSGQNYELLIKVVDGRVVNGRWWFFSGPLTNVQYVITVTDTSTGISKSYTVLNGQVTPIQDVSTFVDVVEY